MTAEDARVKVTLPDHPKTKKLIRRCGQAGAWNLIRLFLFATANRPDGDLSGMDGDDIEIAADWQGDPGAFIAALVDVRFLVGEPGAFSINDWADHNPWAAGSERRSEKAKFNALKRHHGEKYAIDSMPEYAASIGAAPKNHAAGNQDDCQQHASSTTPACEQHASSNAPSPSPSPSKSEDQKLSAGKPPKKSKRQLAAEYPLPDWIDRALWVKWIDGRNKPAAGLDENIAKLDGWRQKGHDPAAILREAIAGGWQGLYLPKNLGETHDHHGSGSGRPSAVERIRQNIERSARERAQLTVIEGTHARRA